jgi:DNA mismatch endonuclease (patch repair protein)
MIVKDPLSPAERSERMSRVRGTGNKSTEGRVESALREHGVSGWVKHPPDIPGKPDFFFPAHRLAVFVDGCFWHACPKCGRIPKSRVEFWQGKIEENRRRDNRTRRKLRREGYHVMRVWEHAVRSQSWLARLRSMLRKMERRELAGVSTTPS